MAKEINETEFNELINGESLVVVDFHADWCGPCKVLSPILDELDTEIDNVEFVKLNVDNYPELSGSYGIMAVPTVIMFQNGEMKDRFSGVQPKEVISEKVLALGDWIDLTDRTLLKIILFIQSTILLLVITGLFYVRSELLFIRGEVASAISNIIPIFEEISLILPGLNSSIDIVLSLGDSLAILDNINNLLNKLLGG